MNENAEASAARLRELEAEYARARSRDFGPISKRMAEETDVLAAEIRHPESAR